MERPVAYKASDGSLWNNSREWVEHEFYLLLCECTMNADKEMAASVIDRFKEFSTLYSEFDTDVRYGEGKRLGLVLDRRTIPIYPVPPAPSEPPKNPIDHSISAPLDTPIGNIPDDRDDIAF